jgi:hypothetical protein
VVQKGTAYANKIKSCNKGLNSFSIPVRPIFETIFLYFGYFIALKKLAFLCPQKREPGKKTFTFPLIVGKFSRET